jgi:hypothetical protein
MRSDRATHLLVVRVVLFVWLFLSLVALTEQLNLRPETGTQDEEALARLAFGLRSDISECQEPSDLAAASPELGGPSALLSMRAVLVVSPLTVPVLLSPSLHQRLSVLLI